MAIAQGFEGALVGARNCILGFTARGQARRQHEVVGNSLSGLFVAYTKIRIPS